MYATKKDLLELKDGMGNQFKELKDGMDKQFQKGESIYSTKTDLLELKDGMDKQFQKITKTMDTVAQLLGKHVYTKDFIDKKFNGVDQKFAAMDQRFDKVESRLDRVENKSDLLFERVGQHKQEFNVFRKNEFKQLADKVDQIDKKLDKVSIEPKATKLKKEVDTLKIRVTKIEKQAQPRN